MKLFVISAVALTLAGAATAAPNPSFELRGFGVSNNSGLSASTVARLNAAVHGSGTESEKALKVRSILRQAGR